MPVFARSAAVACAETPSHSREPGNIWVRVRVSFTTGAARSVILATAGLLVIVNEHCNPVRRATPYDISPSGPCTIAGSHTLF